MYWCKVPSGFSAKHWRNQNIEIKSGEADDNRNGGEESVIEQHSDKNHICVDGSSTTLSF
jgi:hypothetical protein